MLITDCRRACPEARTDRAVMRASAVWLTDAIEAGVDIIQVRERWAPGGALSELVATLVAAARGTATTIVVNDRVDVAIAADAHGVHLRDDGWSVARVRRLIGAERRIGTSIHAVEQAASSDVDYLVFGAVFTSGAKPGRGIAALAAVCAAAATPVFAVGGIGPAQVGACREAGASGVAAISVFLPAETSPEALGPREAVRRLRYSYETTS